MSETTTTERPIHLTWSSTVLVRTAEPVTYTDPRLSVLRQVEAMIYCMLAVCEEHDEDGTMAVRGELMQAHLHAHAA